MMIGGSLLKLEIWDVFIMVSLLTTLSQSDWFSIPPWVQVGVEEWGGKFEQKIIRKMNYNILVGGDNIPIEVQTVTISKYAQDISLKLDPTILHLVVDTRSADANRLFDGLETFLVIKKEYISYCPVIRNTVLLMYNKMIKNLRSKMKTLSYGDVVVVEFTNEKTRMVIRINEKEITSGEQWTEISVIDINPTIACMVDIQFTHL